MAESKTQAERDREAQERKPGNKGQQGGSGGGFPPGGKPSETGQGNQGGQQGGGGGFQK